MDKRRRLYIQFQEVTINELNGNLHQDNRPGHQLTRLKPKALSPDPSPTPQQIILFQASRLQVLHLETCPPEEVTLADPPMGPHPNRPLINPSPT